LSAGAADGATAGRDGAVQAVELRGGAAGLGCTGGGATRAAATGPTMAAGCAVRARAAAARASHFRCRLTIQPMVPAMVPKIQMTSWP
jgi:hypothetical protein